MSCFSVNETTGRKVLEFADDFNFNAKAPVIYYYWNLLFSFTSMTLNALLCFVIIRFPNRLIKINPMLLANSIIDFLFATAYFLYGQYVFAGYDRIFTIYIGLVRISDPTFIRFVNLLMSILVAATFNVVVVHFIYRLLLVTYNEKPRGIRLVFFLFSCYSLAGFHFYAMIRRSSSTPSVEDIDDTVLILKHYNFDVQPSTISGRIVKPNPEFSIQQILPSTLSLIEFAVIIFCTVAIRRILKRSSGTRTIRTRKLNQSMDRTLFCMGLIPIISNVFPSLVLPLLINRCQSNAIISMFMSSCYLSSTFLNPIVLITFIRSYRNPLFRLVTFGFWKPESNYRSSVVRVSIVP